MVCEPFIGPDLAYWHREQLLGESAIIAMDPIEFVSNKSAGVFEVVHYGRQSAMGHDGYTKALDVRRDNLYPADQEFVFRLPK